MEQKVEALSLLRIMHFSFFVCYTTGCGPMDVLFVYTYVQDGHVMLKGDLGQSG